MSSVLLKVVTVLFLVFATFAPTTSLAVSQNALFGHWASEGSIIEITSKAGRLSGRVVALMEPTYAADEKFGPVGAQRRDDMNPKSSLRTQTVLGLELLSQYTFTGKRWEGKIYDPESGNTYSSYMQVDKQGNLKMRGYIGIALLGRTALFTPLAKCTARMQQMLANSHTKIGECSVVAK